MALQSTVQSAKLVKTQSLVGGLALLLTVSMVVSLAIGPTGISFAALPKAIAGLGAGADADSVRARIVLLEVRLPRTILATVVGAGLALAGAMMQGLFRNPLADPSLIGISTGAALGAVIVIALGNSLAASWTRQFGVYAVPFAAVFGGLSTTLLLTRIATRKGTLAIGTLLLCGLAVAALAGAMIGLISYASDDRELRDLTLWMLGSLAGASWPKVLAVVPFALVVAIAVPRLVRGLNGLLLGEAEAFHLGINVERVKALIIAATAAAIGAAVAVAGIIGFVGIVVPHLVRLIAGPDHRVVLPASALLGAVLVTLADIAARMLVRPAELPIGIVLALVGAPIFLNLVMRRSVGGME
jgi:iron complex transport system permease protein